MERALGETNRRREKQIAYNLEHGITPETVKKNVEDVLAGLYEGDVDMNRVTAQIDKPMHGANLEAHLNGLRDQMRKAAENLEFEEAARLRDEVKRLEAVDLAISDDPLARQSAVEAASEAAVKSRGRSTAGKAGTRAYRASRRRSFRNYLPTSSNLHASEHTRRANIPLINLPIEEYEKPSMGVASEH